MVVPLIRPTQTTRTSETDKERLEFDLQQRFGVSPVARYSRHRRRRILRSIGTTRLQLPALVPPPPPPPELLYDDEFHESDAAHRYPWSSSSQSQSGKSVKPQSTKMRKRASIVNERDFPAYMEVWVRFFYAPRTTKHWPLFEISIALKTT